ncbi:MAG TPA: histone deacetylase [Candidatus Acidoferrum sp.]|jgi:acetoin utilization deacetylase AcuC-like enzyme
MLPFKLIYHERYDLNLGAHVFPSQKYRLIETKLVNDGIAHRDDFLRPEPATDEDLLRVHTPDWISKLKTGTLTLSDVMKLEVPYSPELVSAFWLAAGGTILAAQSALQDGFGCNIGGGFHHAHAGHGEGFCAIHDVAVAIRRLQSDGAIRKAMVIDTDVHHGNGTAAIFAKDDSVFTLSIHQLNNYPAYKPPSNIDLDMADNVGDQEYLDKLFPAMRTAIKSFSPDMIFAVGGADPYREDQLGGLKLSMEGLQLRDSGVFEEARKRQIPVVTVLAGGYASRVEDTVQIHINTILAAKSIADKHPHQKTLAAE